MKTKELLLALWNKEKFMVGLVAGFLLCQFITLIILLIIVNTQLCGIK